MPSGMPSACCTRCGRAASCCHEPGGRAASPCSAPCSSEDSAGGGGGCTPPYCGCSAGRPGSGCPPRKGCPGRNAAACGGGMVPLPGCPYAGCPYAAPGWPHCTGCADAATRCCCGMPCTAGAAAPVACRAAVTAAAAPGGSTACDRLSTILRNCGRREDGTSKPVPVSPCSTLLQLDAAAVCKTRHKGRSPTSLRSRSIICRSAARWLRSTAAMACAASGGQAGLGKGERQLAVAGLLDFGGQGSKHADTAQPPAHWRARPPARLRGAPAPMYR